MGQRKEETEELLSQSVLLGIDLFSEEYDDESPAEKLPEDNIPDTLPETKAVPAEAASSCDTEAAFDMPMERDRCYSEAYVRRKEFEAYMNKKADRQRKKNPFVSQYKCSTIMTDKDKEAAGRLSSRTEPDMAEGISRGMCITSFRDSMKITKMGI